MAYYAVKKGINPGIYDTWDECKENIQGFSGAEFHKFKTSLEAEAWMSNGQRMHRTNNDVDMTKLSDENLLIPYAFVDGSYNPSTKVYGYGLYMQYANESGQLDEFLFNGSGSDEIITKMRNIAGELLGALAAIEQAIKVGLSKIHIYYDYTGIEMWAVGLWNTQNPWIQQNYIKRIEELKQDIEIIFIKTPAHSGVEGNETADKLAKLAVGL